MRLLVVSHACSVDVNRDVYRALAGLGHDVHLVVPLGWPTAFAAGGPSARTDELTVHPLPVRLAGRVQRHLYHWRDVGLCLLLVAPAVVLVEEEAFSLAGTQWAAAARRRGLPYALQHAENLPDRLPAWWLPVVRRNLGGAALVLARSRTAVGVARRWGATGIVEPVPHALPLAWAGGDASVRTGAELVVGLAGRLVPEKGVAFLVDVLAGLELGRPVRLLVAGRGPEEVRLVRLAASGIEVERVALSHERMDEFYRRLDVLAVPSRTTPRWTEQFGRVISEAASFGVPVVGSDSGEIGWVVRDLGAGRTVGEDDVAGWRASLSELAGARSARDASALRDRALERYGSRSVAAHLDRLLGEVLDPGLVPR